MFPFDIDDEDIDLVIEDKEDTIADYEIDLKTGKLTGRIIRGLEAIKQWVIITLSTDRYYYNQFSWSYGSELNTLIGKNYTSDYVESEVKRMLNEALLIRKEITGLEDIKVSMEKDKLTVSFTLNTIYGKERMNV